MINIQYGHKSIIFYVTKLGLPTTSSLLTALNSIMVNFIHIWKWIMLITSSSSFKYMYILYCRITYCRILDSGVILDIFFQDSQIYQSNDNRWKLKLQTTQLPKKARFQGILSDYVFHLIHKKHNIQFNNP